MKDCRRGFDCRELTRIDLVFFVCAPARAVFVFDLRAFDVARADLRPEKQSLATPAGGGAWHRDPSGLPYRLEIGIESPAVRRLNAQAVGVLERQIGRAHV